ncbi:MAG TPA: hypothetical protein VGC99_06135 [Candidatus Tectomicrobia bacterium]
MRITYRIDSPGHGPTALFLNGQTLAFTREANPWPHRGTVVPMAAVRERLTVGRNELLVCLGSSIGAQGTGLPGARAIPGGDHATKSSR